MQHVTGFPSFSRLSDIPFAYPSSCQLMSHFLPPFGHCEQCCNQHEGADICKILLSILSHVRSEVGLPDQRFQASALGWPLYIPTSFPQQ